MLNHIVIMGRLTRDPELRYTSTQIPVASFSVAVDRDYSGRDGAEKQTDFFDCTAWRNTAEFVSKYFTKGSMAVVSGRLQFRDWTDRDGNKRRSAELVVENIYFGESKRSRDEYQASHNYGGSYGQSGNTGSSGGAGQGNSYGAQGSQNSSYGGQNSNYGGQNSSYGSYGQNSYSNAYGSNQSYGGDYGAQPNSDAAGRGGANAGGYGDDASQDDFGFPSPGNDASSSFSDLSETDGELPF